MYSILCRCGNIYIGQIKCSIERTEEHNWYIRIHHPDKLAVAEHSINGTVTEEGKTVAITKMVIRLTNPSSQIEFTDPSKSLPLMPVTLEGNALSSVNS
jgi:hypothetical protein